MKSVARHSKTTTTTTTTSKTTMQQIPSIPLVQYTKVFGSINEANAKHYLAEFERSLCPMGHRNHKLTPQVMAYLLLAPHNREVAHALLQRQTISSLHMVITPTHALFVVNGAAWSMASFARGKFTCVSYAHEKFETPDLRCAVSDFPSCLAHAMALADILPQAVMVYFPTVQRAMHCRSLSHLPSNLMRWARKNPELRPFCPAATLAPSASVPPSAPALALTKTKKTKMYEMATASPREKAFAESQRCKKLRLNHTRELIRRAQEKQRLAAPSNVTDFGCCDENSVLEELIVMSPTPKLSRSPNVCDIDLMSSMDLKLFLQQRENAVARRRIL